MPTSITRRASTLAQWDSWSPRCGIRSEFSRKGNDAYELQSSQKKSAPVSSLSIQTGSRIAMTPEEALMTILRLIDGSEEVQEEELLQVLLRSVKTLAEKGLGREPT
jgi:hypothetical protein